MHLNTELKMVRNKKTFAQLKTEMEPEIQKSQGITWEWHCLSSE